MPGDDRARFCDQCQKHVYNLAVMSADETIDLIRETEGQFCGRLYQRRDSTVLSGDCPVGFRRMRRALVTQFGLASAAFAALPAWSILREVLTTRSPAPAVADEPAPPLPEKPKPQEEYPMVPGAIAVPASLLEKVRSQG
jgi:hypothetical protein